MSTRENISKKFQETVERDIDILSAFIKSHDRSLFKETPKQFIFNIYIKFSTFSFSTKNVETSCADLRFYEPKFTNLLKIFIKEEIDDHIPNCNDLLVLISEKSSIYNTFAKCLIYIFSQVSESFKKLPYKIFYDSVIVNHYDLISKRINDLIREERTKNNFSKRNFIKNLVSIVNEIDWALQMKFYEESIEKIILTDIKQFYSQKTEEWYENNFEIYLQHVKIAIENERDRIFSCLKIESEIPVMTEMYNTLLRNRLEVLPKHFIEYLSLNNLGALHNLYTLYSFQEQDLEPCATAFGNFIREKGLELLEQHKNNPTELVKSVIDIHVKYADIIVQTLNSSVMFHKKFRNGCIDFINNTSIFSITLARYAHSLLQKSSRIETTSLDHLVSHIVSLYGYCENKDIFEYEYQRLLAYRLLEDQSNSENFEKMIITKLKVESGYQWTNKLEEMMKDMTVSKQFGEEIKRTINFEKCEKIDFNLTILTKAYWNSSLVPCKIPKYVEKCFEKSKNYFISKHAMKKLELWAEKGSADVVVDFSKTVKVTLSCTTIMMMILTTFNEKTIVTLQEIVDMTGLLKGVIRSHLLSLCHPKVKVLLKKPNVAELLETDQFMINSKFTSEYRKIKIPLMEIRNTNDEKNMSKEEQDEKRAIELFRSNFVQATIVRIMKSRKQLSISRLIIETIQQCMARFKPDNSFIKKQIEMLIEREYVRRSDEIRTDIEYIA